MPLLGLLQECPNDARAKATRLKTERVKAYYYPLWDSSATCMFGVKSYLVVDNTTLDDNGEYFFNMTVTSRLHPLFSYTIIRTVNVSIGKPFYCCNKTYEKWPDSCRCLHSRP